MMGWGESEEEEEGGRRETPSELRSDQVCASKPLNTHKKWSASKPEIDLITSRPAGEGKRTRKLSPLGTKEESPKTHGR